MQYPDIALSHVI